MAIMKDTEITIKVDGMPYKIDVADLTGKEVGLLKQHGGIKGLNDLSDALLAGDLQAFAALAGVAIMRSGITPNWNQLMEYKMSQFEVEVDEENPTSGAKAPKKTD